MGKRLHFDGKVLGEPLKNYHPAAQKAFRAMQHLESKPWSHASDAEHKRHEETFRRHTEVGIHPMGEGPPGMFPTAVIPKKPHSVLGKGEKHGRSS